MFSLPFELPGFTVTQVEAGEKTVIIGATAQQTTAICPRCQPCATDRAADQHAGAFRWWGEQRACCSPLEPSRHHRESRYALTPGQADHGAAPGGPQSPGCR